MGKQITGYDWQEVRENELERLADVLEEHLDLSKILQIAKSSP